MVCQIEDSDVKKNTLSYVPHLTLPYLEPHSLIIIITLLLSLSLPQHYPTFPYLNSLLQVITVFQPFPTPAVVSFSPNKTKQTKPQHGVNNSLYSLTFNSSFLLGAGLAPYLLLILSSTPESELPPVGGTPYPTAPCWQRWQPLLVALVRERGFFCRGDFFVGVMVRMIVRLLAFSVR